MSETSVRLNVHCNFVGSVSGRAGWFLGILGRGCNIQTHLLSMSGDSTTSLESILSRSGRAVAHDEEQRAFERSGKRAASGPNMDTWAALGICRFRDGSGMYGPEPQIADAPGPAGNPPGDCGLRAERTRSSQQSALELTVVSGTGLTDSLTLMH